MKINATLFFIRTSLIPTENERKYVLNLNCEDEMSNLSNRKTFIDQGYLMSNKGMSLRVRRTEYEDTMTFKQKVNNRVVEIEKKISKRDFDDLWEGTINRLSKVRYDIPSDGLVWEVDFFKNDQDTYFSQAEVELPEGVVSPENVPNFINENLLFNVPENDNRFSSRKLSSISHAKVMLKELGVV